MRKVLYVSDLDGTLLRSTQRTSDYTNRVINRLAKMGIVFSYATARSIYTSSAVTEGLNAAIPVIVYNGAFIVDNRTREVIDSSFLDQGVYAMLREMLAAGVYPIVYAVVDGKERFSYDPGRSSAGVLDFVATRTDERKRAVYSDAGLTAGRIFYLACIDAPEKLEPFFERYRDRYHCVYQRDIYSGEQWLEIMPKSATKASAIRRLKRIAQCDYVVAFGDGVNDIEMFEDADECYAMANAAPELKARATAVIGSNDEDGVAHWLEENVLHCCNNPD